MKENYRAWEIDTEEFYRQKTNAEKLKFLLRFAVLAPSSHNTQPWSFSVSDSAINVYQEPSRHLPIADSNNRQSLLSIGCAIKNILIAADHYGYSTDVGYFQENGDNNLVATINFTPNGNSKEKSDLIKEIPKRVTNRNKYLPEKISPEIINEIKATQTDNVSLFFVSETGKLEQLADIAVNASINSMIDNGFRFELAQYLKHNLTKSKVGMPGFSLGVPTPISFLLPHMMRRFNLEKAAQRQNQTLFREHTPHIGILTTKRDSQEDWLEAGQVFEEIAIILTKHGISTSPWGAPIQIGEFYKNIQELLGTADRPQMFFRVGRAIKPTKKSPRMSHETITK